MQAHEKSLFVQTRLQNRVEPQNRGAWGSMGDKKAEYTQPSPTADLALSCLARGDAEQAESLLRTHLRHNPEDAQAWHAMACVARAGGKAAVAVALASKAVGFGAEPFFYLTLGLALLELGHVGEARAAVNVVVLSTPQDPRAQDAMAQIMEKMGRLDEAEQALKKALALRPLEQVRHMTLAAFLARHGRAEDAAVVSARALALGGEAVAAHNLHGMVLEQAGRLAQAEPHFAIVAQAMPDNAQALANHGAALFAQQRYGEAEAALRSSAALAPAVVQTRANLGLVCMAQGDLHMAEAELATAYRLQPSDARLALNYGTVLMDLERREEAEALFVQAMHYAATTPDKARATLNLATLCLATGRFAQGWALFEARKTLLAPPLRVASLPEWDGTTTAKTVLLYAEQGLGDSLQFLRYVDAAAQKAPINLLVPQTMQRLVQCLLPRWHGQVSLCTPEQAAMADVRCSLLSLPYVLDMAGPWAWQVEGAWGANPTKPVRSKSVLVGLCWAGNPRYQFDLRRSIAPGLLRHLAGVRDVCFQALQPCADFLTVPIPVLPLPEGDLLAMARVMASLDVVVSVDTMVIHLAGLMGKPALLLNRYGGDWRWGAGSVVAGTPPGALERSVWYPSVQIARQQAPVGGKASWLQPLAAAAQWLEQAVQAKSSG